jgi:hypothetical protein
MKQKVFGFKNQLKVGNKGENYFIKCYHKLNPRKSSSKEIDIIIEDNKKVELKSDSYSMDKTPNFFLEKIGNNVSGKLGGAHRAVADGIDWFVYLYMNDKTFFWFKPEDLKNFIDSNKQLEEKRVLNKSYHSIGVLIPRELVKHLVFRTDTF